MKGYLGSVWRSIFEPFEHPPVFIGGVLLLGFGVNQMSSFLSAWISQHVTLLSWPGALIAFAIPALLVALAFLLRPGPELTTRGPAKQSRGLVVLVSKGSGQATASAAIAHHLATLKHAWLVHSPGSCAEAMELEREYAGHSQAKLELVALSDENFKDVEAVWDAIERRVYGSLPAGWRQSDVIIDYTGGFKETTIGAFLAALSPGRRMQRTPPATADPKTGAGISPGTPIEVDISYRLWRVKPRHRRTAQ